MKYFVAYAYFLKNGAHGFGNIEVQRSWPISGTDDITDLTSQITDDLSRAMKREPDVTIIGWQRFEDDVERIRGQKGDSGNVVHLLGQKSTD